MHRIFFLFVASLLLCRAASAQPLNLLLMGRGIYTSEPWDHYIVPTDNGFVDMEFSLKGGMFTKAANLGYALTLTRYSNDMVKQQQVKLKADDYPSGPFAPKLISADGKPVLLFYRYDATAEKVALYWAPVDPGSLAIGAGKELLHWEMKNSSAMNLNKEQVSLRTRLIYSADRSKMAVIRSSNSAESFRVAVFDKEGTLQWSGVHSVPLTNEDFDTGDGLVSNDGRVYFPYALSMKATRPNAFIVIMDAKGFDKQVTVSERQLTQVSLCLSPDEKTVHIAGGIFSDDANMAGVYRARLDEASLKVVDFQPTLFTEDFKKNFDASALPRTFGRPRSVPNCGMKLLQFADGSLSLTGTGQYSNPEHTQFGASSILSVRFGAGQPVISKVPRFWRTFYSPGAGVNVVASGNNTLVLYNDVASNLTRSLEEEPLEASYRNGVLVAATIGADGSVQRSLAVNPLKESLLPMPEFTGYSDKRVYVPLWQKLGEGLPNKAMRWALITLP